MERVKFVFLRFETIQLRVGLASFAGFEKVRAGREKLPQNSQSNGNLAAMFGSPSSQALAGNAWNGGSASTTVPKTGSFSGLSWRLS